MTCPEVETQLVAQVETAVAQSGTGAFQFGEGWENGDVTSHSQVLPAMGSEAYALIETATDPAVDLTASSFLMWSWRIAGKPSYAPSLWTRIAIRSASSIGSVDSAIRDRVCSG